MILDRKEAGRWKAGRRVDKEGKEVKEDRNPWNWTTPTKLYNFYDADDAVQATTPRNVVIIEDRDDIRGDIGSDAELIG